MVRPETRNRREEGVPPWIKALAGLVALVFAANGIFVWMSLSGRRDLVRDDYYQAGLEQDARLARRALAASHAIGLGISAGEWTVTATRRTEGAEPPPGSGADSAQLSALAGSQCRVSFNRPEDGREDRTAVLAWAGDGTVDGAGGGADDGAAGGTWRGPALPLRKGHWDVLIEWERNGEVFMESAFPRYLGD